MEGGGFFYKKNSIEMVLVEYSYFVSPYVGEFIQRYTSFHFRIKSGRSRPYELMGLIKTSKVLVTGLSLYLIGSAMIGHVQKQD